MDYRDTRTVCEHINTLLWILFRTSFSVYSLCYEHITSVIDLNIIVDITLQPDKFITMESLS